MNRSRISFIFPYVASLILVLNILTPVYGPPPVKGSKAFSVEGANDGRIADSLDHLNSPQLKSLRIVPSTISLFGPANEHRFLVMGAYSDGVERDVTLSCGLSVSAPEVVRVDQNSKLVSFGSGKATLKAQLNGLAATASIRVNIEPEREPFNFQREIGTILVRRGCAASECHAGVKGRGGFKLSLDAMYPEKDYRWIKQGGNYQVLVAEPEGPMVPRVNIEQPDKSLLLLKPTKSVPHHGGNLIQVGSNDYRTILDWVRRGAPYDEAGAEELRATKISINPSEVFLTQGATQQLLIIADLVDGRQEDWTGRARYKSDNPDVIEVDQSGIMRAHRPGEAVITVRVPGKAVATRMGVIDRIIPEYPPIPGRNLIDEHVFAKLRKLHILPSELSTDWEFLRRVCLDLTGTLPPPERVREFLASRDPKKRDRLIEVLMDSPEYIDFWTYRFSDPFRVALSATYPSSPKGAFWYSEWIRKSIEQNKPYDQMARERISAQGSYGATRHFRPRLPSDTMNEQVRVFMGRRLDCAQCHDHPFEPWSQDQFWGMAAFFGRLAYVFNYTDYRYAVVDMTTGTGMHGDETPVTHPRTKKIMEPVFLDGRKLTENEQEDPRLALADWVTSQPYFSEAAVNRIWSFFFGRGLVQPVDDFRTTNPPTHPRLLQALADEFRKSGYDVRHLIRLIVQSRTYQLSATPNRTNFDDNINYSRSVPRRMEAEVLLDAISQITGVPEIFERKSASAAAAGREPLGTKAIQLRESDAHRSLFLDAYGRPDRAVVPERNHQANLAQALHQLVGSTSVEKLGGKGGRIDRLIESAATDGEIIEELSLAALGRFPQPQEKKVFEEMISARSSRREALEDLLWGLINAPEFVHIQ